jgi:hypothetical protein
MKMIRLSCLGLAAALALLAHSPARSADSDPIAAEESAAAKGANRAEWDAALKEKYSLTDQQLLDLRAKGLNNPQIAIVSQLAQSSGKTTDEIIKMRQEQKMGWGRIAKELGVSPREIGQSVASLRRGWSEERSEARKERRRDRREERRAAREQRKAQRRQNH